MKACTIFVLPDQHYSVPGCKDGGVDPSAESVALQAIAIAKPDVFVNLGDVGEFTSVSHWRYKKVKRPPLQYQIAQLQPEIDACNAGLDRFDKALDKVKCETRWTLQGNHCFWLSDFILANPFLERDYAWHNALRFKERGHQWKGYGEYLKIGHLLFYHGGHWTGVNHARDHARNLGQSVIYGHTHDVQVAKVQHFGGAHGAWSMGCIAKMDKPFLKGRPTNWGHAVGIVHMESDGTFHVEVVDIFNGAAWIYGKRVEAK